ncbi:MAG: hypothetical protein GY774_36540 [Planctomycetes bacterium]|nr:hypothetical protein [Planctomycetota bacterium]
MSRGAATRAEPPMDVDEHPPAVPPVVPDLQDENELNDPAVLRARIHELEDQIRMMPDGFATGPAPVPQMPMGVADVPVETPSTPSEPPAADVLGGQQVHTPRAARLHPQNPAPQMDQSQADPVLLDATGVTRALQEMLGTSFDGTGDVLSTFLLDGSLLDSKTKSKIWSGEFVELGAMIPKNHLKPKVDMNYAAGAGNQISFTPTQAKQPASFQEWVSWFSIYCSVYTERYPESAPQLFSYINKVLELYRDEPNTYIWRSYDELFRRIKSMCPSLRWHIVHPEIIRKARSEFERLTFAKRRNEASGRGKPFKRNASSSDPKVGSTGTCNIFNEGKVCPFKNCRYSHVCSSCKGQHTKVQCPLSTPRAVAGAR